MKKILGLMDSFLSILLMISILTMLADVTWQVVTRYFFQNPSSYTEEIARFSVVWLGFFGGAYAYRRKAHIALDLFSNHLSQGKNLFLSLLAISIVFLFSSTVLIYGGTKIVMMTLLLKQKTASLSIPIAYIYSAIPLSGFFIALYSAENFFTLLKKRGHKT